MFLKKTNNHLIVNSFIYQLKKHNNNLNPATLAGLTILLLSVPSPNGQKSILIFNSFWKLLCSKLVHGRALIKSSKTLIYLWAELFSLSHSLWTLLTLVFLIVNVIPRRLIKIHSIRKVSNKSVTRYKIWQKKKRYITLIR